MQRAKRTERLKSAIDCITAYIHHHTSHIVCPNCNSSKTVNILIYKDLHRPLRTRCGCKHIFHVILETRTYYRKPVNLHGVYWNRYRDTDIGEMRVESLSRTGIGFRTNLTHRLQPHDLLTIEFALDDPQRSIICKTAIVRHVQDRSVGAEFCEPRDAKLGFYLMP